MVSLTRKLILAALLVLVASGANAASKLTEEQIQDIRTNPENKAILDHAKNLALSFPTDHNWHERLVLGMVYFGDCVRGHIKNPENPALKKCVNKHYQSNLEKMNARAKSK